MFWYPHTETHTWFCSDDCLHSWQQVCVLTQEVEHSVALQLIPPCNERLRRNQHHRMFSFHNVIISYFFLAQISKGVGHKGETKVSHNKVYYYIIIICLSFPRIIYSVFLPEVLFSMVSRCLRHRHIL